VRATADAFSRPDQRFGLGATPQGLEWRSVGGAWGVSRSTAYVSGPAPAPARALAVLDVAGGDGSVQVTLPRVANGAGLVFRYQDPANFWAVVAVPDYATWAVVRALAGQEQVVANTGVSAVRDGTTVGVRTSGDTIEVLVDRAVAATVSDGALRSAGAVGMTAGGSDAGRARFDDFRFEAAAPGRP